MRTSSWIRWELSLRSDHNAFKRSRNTINAAVRVQYSSINSFNLKSSAFCNSKWSSYKWRKCQILKLRLVISFQSTKVKINFSFHDMSWRLRTNLKIFARGTTHKLAASYLHDLWDFQCPIISARSIRQVIKEEFLTNNPNTRRTWRLKCMFHRLIVQLTTDYTMPIQNSFVPSHWEP